MKRPTLKEVLDQYGAPEAKYLIYMPDFGGMVNEVERFDKGYYLRIVANGSVTTLPLILDNVIIVSGVPMLERLKGGKLDSLIILKHSNLSGIQ